MDPFSSSYPLLIKQFGFSRVYNLSKKVSFQCLLLLEYVLYHELDDRAKKEADLQEFAIELFGDVSESDSSTVTVG